jgi:radical SAM-linked protein
MYYSQGFHPKPEMMFGPALPLGVASFAEYVDVKLIQAPGLDAQTIHDRLTGASLEGIEFTDAVMLDAKDPPLSKAIDRADYVVGLPRASLDALNLADADALREHIARRLAGELVIVRDNKGIKRNIDIKQYLRTVEVGAGAESLARAGMVGGLVPVAFSLHVPGQGGARASEVIEAMLGAAETSARLVRTFMGMGEHTPLALEVLRMASAPLIESADSHAETARTLAVAEE